MHPSKRRVVKITEDIEKEVRAEGKAESCFCHRTELTAVHMVGGKAVFILNQQKAIGWSCPDVEIDIAADIDLIFDPQAQGDHVQSSIKTKTDGFSRLKCPTDIPPKQ